MSSNLNLNTMTIPEAMARMQVKDIRRSDLSLLAEWLGQNSDDPEVIRLLTKLLDHPAAYVREGTLIGLARHIANTDVQQVIENLSYHDPSEDLRELAREILEELPWRLLTF